jgi:hypothetical protein
MSPFRSHRITTAGLLAAGLTVLAPLAVASAAGAEERPQGIEALKQAAHTAIVERTTALDRATAVVRRSPFMGDDAAARIDAMYTASVGLQALDAEIQGDTTVASVREDAAKITRDYRVFVLVLPVTHLTRSADAVTAEAVPKLDRLAVKLQKAIDAKGAASLQPLLDDLKAKAADASQQASPVPSSIGSLTAADWNADHEVLSPARHSVRTAREDVRAARADARKIIDGLKQA